MIISKTHNCIFIHIPKAGGSSILRPLFDSSLPEGSVILNQQLDSTDGILFDWGFRHNHGRAKRRVIRQSGLFSFSFVRNPWDRAVSLYYWQMRLCQLQGMNYKAISFSDFVHQLDRGRFTNGPKGFDFLVKPQCKWLVDWRGVNVDFVGKIEFVERDMRRVYKSLGVTPKDHQRIINKNSLREGENYRNCYSDSLAEMVGRTYAEDVERWDYQFLSLLETH